jgi:hypothetical protein
MVTKQGFFDNNLSVDADGVISPIKQKGPARINWTKITANNITLDAGTSSDTVTDLQVHADGNSYHITEAAAAPGQRLTIEFINVTAFNWINIMGCYSGSSTHGIGIQLFNFNTAGWDTFNGAQNHFCDITTDDQNILADLSFFVPNDSDYIGTGGDLGDVRIRLNHTPSGNASHDSWWDVVALYQ